MGVDYRICTEKKGSLSFFVNYPKLNTVTIQDNNPLPGMNERINILCSVDVFSTIDANTAYCQIELVEADIRKPAFF